MNAKDVINTILTKENITGAKLAKDIGMNRAQAIYDIQSGKVMRISLRMANRIHDAKPQYRLDWLLTGSGDMYDGDYQPKEDSVSAESTHIDPMSVINKLVESNTKKDEELQRLRQAYERMAESLERLTNK